MKQLNASTHGEQNQALAMIDYSTIFESNIDDFSIKSSYLIKRTTIVIKMSLTKNNDIEYKTDVRTSVVTQLH